MFKFRTVYRRTNCFKILMFQSDAMCIKIIAGPDHVSVANHMAL